MDTDYSATGKHRKTQVCSVFICVLLWLPVLCSSVGHAQWPQWRGPGGLGISKEKDLPIEWSPATDDKPAVNIRWTTEIPGRGHSSPIVAGNLVFVTTSIKGEQVPGRKAPVHLDFNRLHEVLRTNSVGEPVYASPAIANGTIYIRGVTHLFAIANMEKKK
jgi:hypothetical protein